MTAQIADEVDYPGTRYAITAVDGEGLFDPAEQGVTPGPSGTGCWHGFHCRYLIRQDRLILDEVHMGRTEVGFEAGRLVSAHDRSAAPAEVRDRLGKDGLRPAAGESISEWVSHTFSLSFDYSWPTRCATD
ncbi:MAG TPA: hypothetical protein VFC19_10270 [Candidatus Limnocylindrales bacterium]|nr:hypothetical protein [Candidatus Limnocylindrales bacterium]